MESANRIRSWLVACGQNPLLIMSMYEHGFILGAAADIESLFVVCCPVFFGNELQVVQTQKDYIVP